MGEPRLRDVLRPFIGRYCLDPDCLDCAKRDVELEAAARAWFASQPVTDPEALALLRESQLAYEASIESNEAWFDYQRRIGVLLAARAARTETHDG